jgi:hypothetical protein
LEWDSVTDWQPTDDRNNREQISRARQAAEELFTPPQHKSQPAAAASPPNGGLAAEHPPRREPRIFTIPPRVPAGAQSEAPPEPKPGRQKPAVRRPAAAVPLSQIGRVRALTSYGMTAAQVAELYDVSIGEIERILRAPVLPGKSR